jgi:hypothetical protein
MHSLPLFLSLSPSLSLSLSLMCREHFENNESTPTWMVYFNYFWCFYVFLFFLWVPGAGLPHSKSFHGPLVREVLNPKSQISGPEGRLPAIPSAIWL